MEIITQLMKIMVRLIIHIILSHQERLLTKLKASWFFRTRHENLTEVFSKKEKINILKYRFNSLPQLVEYAHFNDKYPQFKNILITNTQNTLAYKYDTKKKHFIAVNKDDLLDNIVDERMCDINSFYEELENELDEKTKEILDKVKDKIENDPAYKELKKKDIKLIIYNNRKKVSKEIIKESNIEI